MKKPLAALSILISALALGLTGCSGNPGSGASSPIAPPSVTAAETQGPASPVRLTRYPRTHGHGRQGAVPWGVRR